MEPHMPANVSAPAERVASQREVARRLGISHTALQKAAQAGRIAQEPGGGSRHACRISAAPSKLPSSAMICSPVITRPPRGRRCVRTAARRWRRSLVLGSTPEFAPMHTRPWLRRPKVAVADLPLMVYGGLRDVTWFCGHAKRQRPGDNDERQHALRLSALRRNTYHERTARH